MRARLQCTAALQASTICCRTAASGACPPTLLPRWRSAGPTSPPCSSCCCCWSRGASARQAAAGAAAGAGDGAAGRDAHVPARLLACPSTPAGLSKTWPGSSPTPPMWANRGAVRHTHAFLHPLPLLPCRSRRGATRAAGCCRACAAWPRGTAHRCWATPDPWRERAANPAPASAVPVGCCGRLQTGQALAAPHPCAAPPCPPRAGISGPWPSSWAWRRWMAAAGWSWT